MGRSSDALLYWPGTLVVLMLFAFVKAYRTWEEINEVDDPDRPEDLLETFEEAHAAGDLDDEEFERVRRRLTSSVADADQKTPAETSKDNPLEEL